MTNNTKKAAARYAEILESGAWVTHQEQDEIAKLLRRLIMTEDEAWDELERKQNKKTQPPTVDWEAIAGDQAMTIAILRSKAWIGLDNNDLQYQTPHDVITMRYAEALLKAKNT